MFAHEAQRKLIKIFIKIAKIEKSDLPMSTINFRFNKTNFGGCKYFGNTMLGINNKVN